MSFNISYKTILDNRFPSMMRKLSDHNFASVKETYNLVKVIEGLEQELKTARSAHSKLFLEYKTSVAALEEKYKGKENENENENKSKESDENEKSFQEKMKELLSISFSLDERREKIKLSSLETLKLSATELLVLEELLDFTGFKEADLKVLPPATETAEVTAQG